MCKKAEFAEAVLHFPTAVARIQAAAEASREVAVANRVRVRRQRMESQQLAAVTSGRPSLLPSPLAMPMTWRDSEDTRRMRIVEPPVRRASGDQR